MPILLRVMSVLGWWGLYAAGGLAIWGIVTLLGPLTFFIILLGICLVTSIGEKPPEEVTARHEGIVVLPATERAALVKALQLYLRAIGPLRGQTDSHLQDIQRVLQRLT